MTAPSLSRQRAWAIAIVATLVMMVSYIDRQTLSVLSPTVTAALHISEEAYGWVASAFSIAYLVGAPLAGRWIGRVGARHGLVYAVLIWSAVAALHVFVPGLKMLFALRIGLGLAEAPSFPGAAQAIHRVLPAKDRPRGFGLLFTGSSIGGMVAPSLAIALKRHSSWRLAFVGTAIAGLLWLPLWWWVTSPKDVRAVLDAPPTDDPSPTKLPRPGLCALAADPVVLRAMVLVVAAAPAISFVLLWGARYLVRDHHLTQDAVARYLWLPPLMFDLGAVLAGDLHARRARVLDGSPDRLLVAVGGLLMLAIAAVPWAHSTWGAVMLAGVGMAGGGALFALLTTDMLARVAPSFVSAAGGMTAAAQSLAYVLANPLIGRGVQHWGNYSHVLMALGLWVIPGLIVWLVWTPMKREGVGLVEGG